MSDKSDPPIGSFEEAELHALRVGARLTFREKLESNARMLALGNSFKQQREAAQRSTPRVAEQTPEFGTGSAEPKRPPHTP